MNKEFLESLANYLEKFISNEVEKRCKKLEDEKNVAEWNLHCCKKWLRFLIKDNSINLSKLYKEAERKIRKLQEIDTYKGICGWSKEELEADYRKNVYQQIKEFYEFYEDA